MPLKGESVGEKVTGFKIIRCLHSNKFILNKIIQNFAARVGLSMGKISLFLLHWGTKAWYKTEPYAAVWCYFMHIILT